MSEEVAVAPRAELGAETTELLQRLIRIDTSNPPGNEGPAQEILHELLSGAGFECEFAARDPERPNLVSRLRGESPGPTLCLLGHVDTVPADASEWAHDPWSGDVSDGELWGRGALDMKDQVAAEVTAAAALGRDGWRPPRGDLLIVTTADEEATGGYGARWLCEERPELVRADMVVNEGAGVAIEVDGRRFYTMSVGEKGPARFHLSTRGVAGHASLPWIGDNALLKMVPLLQRLAEGQPPARATPEAAAFLSAVLDEDLAGADANALTAALERLRQLAPAVAAFLAQPMLGITLTPTRIRASEKDNVIPSLCEVLVDCRVPPEVSEREARDAVAELIGDGDWELELAEGAGGNRSPMEGPLADAIGGWVEENDSGAEIAPTVMAGFSDSHWFRRAFDSATVYGFCPHRAMELDEIAPLVHSADERIAVADLELAAHFFFDLPQRVLR
jgi:acetylornithine deacetylase/succinyl-diaminopimelate desuccinylase-like protein